MIVDSQIIENLPQGESGWRRITEQHTDDYGGFHLVSYLCLTDFDYNSAMLARVSKIEADLIDLDIDNTWNQVLAGIDPRNVVYKWATSTQVARQLLIRFAQAEARVAWLIIPLLDSLTDTQLRNILNVAQSVVNRIRSRVTSLKTLKPLVLADDAAHEVLV